MVSAPCRNFFDIVLISLQEHYGYGKRHLRPVYMETGTPDRRGNPQQVTPPIMYSANVIKLKCSRDYVDKWVTLPKRVTPPTWGPPPLCKQTLSNDVS